MAMIHGKQWFFLLLFFGGEIRNLAKFIFQKMKKRKTFG
jgi:hypothetical protein